MVFARQLQDLPGLRDWSVFVVLCSLLAAARVGVWLVAPVLFLLISALHFSGDPQVCTNFVSRAVYGGR